MYVCVCAADDAQGCAALPLVRLRVELSDGDHDKIPPQRFGAQFVGQVANPDDMLLYLKRKHKASLLLARSLRGSRTPQPDVSSSNARSTEAILRSRERDAASAKQTVEQEVSRILSSRAKATLPLCLSVARAHTRVHSTCLCCPSRSWPWRW